MLTTPQVTVICTCYNHEKFVVEALNSILKQTYSNIQLIITDDFSTDNSRNVISNWLKDKNILFLKNEKNLGSIKTFNKAYKYATGDYIIDFAADDVLLENCVEQQIKTFQNSKYKDLGIVYGNIKLIDENKNLISIYYDDTENPESGNVYKMVIGRTTKICSVAAMTKRSVFEAVNGYDENLAYEDLDLWVRVSRNYSFEYIPQVLAEKRELSNSLYAHFLKNNNSKTYQLHNSTLKILKKILALNTSKEENKVMLNRIQFEGVKLLKSREYKLFIKLFFVAYKAKIRSL